MAENIDNIIIEHLKRMQAEMTSIRQDNAEIKSRLAGIESGIARIGRNDASNFEEIIESRHSVDKLKERIERRLELA
jgi:septal ring factor EnvC (AmiA/AmiB activator)